MTQIKQSPSSRKLLPISKVKFHVTQSHPYFSAILYNLIPVETDKLPTLAVDKYFRLYYNPEMLKLPMKQLIGCMIHEINHVLRGHFMRFDGCDPQVANFAGDCAINEDIRDEGIPLPDFVVYPETFKLPPKLTAEDYYRLLLKEKEKFIKKIKDLIKEGKIQVGSGGCGSCSGNAGGWEIPIDALDEDGDPVGSVDEFTQDTIKRQVARDIVEHSKQAGHVPGNLKRWAEEIYKEKVNWKRELRVVVKNCINFAAGMSDYTRQKPSRRQSIYKDFIMPGFQTPVPKVSMIIDTSGSMGPKDLGQALGEVQGVLKSINAAITVVAYDTQAEVSKNVKALNQIKLSGGGGTEMDKAIKFVDEMKPPSDLIVVVTDGYTAWPQHAAKQKVIAVLTQKDSRNNVPSWIRTIEAYAT